MRYWKNQLCEHKAIGREYTEVYGDLYDYGKIQVENSLKPLKEYYFTNPHAFDIRDPNLMDKALR